MPAFQAFPSLCSRHYPLFMCYHSGRSFRLTRAVRLKVSSPPLRSFRLRSPTFVAARWRSFPLVLCAGSFGFLFFSYEKGPHSDLDSLPPQDAPIAIGASSSGATGPFFPFSFSATGSLVISFYKPKLLFFRGRRKFPIFFPKIKTLPVPPPMIPRACFGPVPSL